MKQENNIANLFPKHLFWDMDCSTLDLKRDKAIIIPRLLYATTSDTFEADIKVLEKLFSPADIVHYLKITKENISNEVCLSVSKRYNVESFQRFVLSRL